MKYVLTDAAVRKLRGVLAPRSGNTGAGGAATPVSPDDFPRPWTVRWSQREANGSGAWCIYFPNVNTTGLVLSPLYYGTTAVVPTGLTASAVLGGTWYTLDNIPASSTAVWLNVVKPSGSGALTAYFTNTYPLPVQNATHWRIQVASLIVDATTGKRRIKQHLASAVNLSKADAEGGGNVNLDDISTDYNGDTEVQIKDWDTGTPAASTTIAQDIHEGNTSQNTLVERTENGVLKYKKPGTLAQLTGSTVTMSAQDFLTYLDWDPTTRTLTLGRATASVQNGIITNWTPQPNVTWTIT